MILTEDQLARATSDPAYVDFLTVHYTQSNILFLGYSFYDPAIKSVLTAINNRYGASPPGRHVALLPDNISGEFVDKLDRLNVEVVRYDPAENHAALWNAIAAASTRPCGDDNTVEQAAEPFRLAKRYLASCYARVRLKDELKPLREAVVEGLVSAVVQRSAPASVLRSEIATSIHKDLAISIDDARSLVDSAVQSLTKDGLCLLQGKRVTWKGAARHTSLDQALRKLVDFAVDRSRVEEGLTLLKDDRVGLRAFYHELVYARGWDLAASFAGRRAPEHVSVRSLLYKHCPFMSVVNLERLERVCLRQISRPTDKEAAILTDLGRASFALELVMRSPRDSLLHESVLPQRVYLDANVLMPAFAFGHPLYATYGKTLGRLREAIAKTGKALEILASYGFLNEIVSHRRLAIEKATLAGPSFQYDALREATYYKSSNVNVFVGAYANLAVSNPDLTFQEYLRSYAPYETEEQLARWLKSREISVMRARPGDGRDYADISLELQRAHATGLMRDKDVRLLEHDAVQIARLNADIAAGLRSIVVTADRQLTHVIARSPFRNLADSMVSNVGLSQLVDLFVGGGDAPRGTAELLWSVRVSNRTEEIRNYLITRALGEYDAAVAMRLPSVVEGLADEFTSEAERLGLRSETEDPVKRHEYFALVGRFEDRFYSLMREQVDHKTEAQH